MFSQESFPKIKEQLPLHSSKAKTDKNTLDWGRVMTKTYRTSQRRGPNLGDSRPHLIPYLIIGNLLYREALADFKETPADRIFCQLESLQLSKKVKHCANCEVPILTRYITAGISKGVTKHQSPFLQPLLVFS